MQQTPTIRIRNNVRAWRLKRRVSLRQLALTVGMQPDQLSRVERHHVGISDYWKVRIAAVLDVQIGDLWYPDYQRDYVARVEKHSTAEAV